MMRLQEARGALPWLFYLSGMFHGERSELQSARNVSQALGAGHFRIPRACAKLNIHTAPSNTSLAEMFQRGGACIASSQTKMVLGLGWSEPARLSAQDVFVACNRLLSPRFFAFVGLTELWDDTLELFHRRFGGHAVPAEATRSYVRSSAGPSTTRNVARAHRRPSAGPKITWMLPGNG